MPEWDRKELERIEIKKKVVSRELPVDIESEEKLSSYQSVPSICVPAQVKETLLQTLIDCGAEEDMISENIIKEKNLHTMPIQPIYIGQVLAKAIKTIVN